MLVVDPGQPGETSVGIPDRLFVGRECLGVDERHRLLIDDFSVSRHHLEIRLDPAIDHAYVVDTSTNGTRLNGTRIERAVPVQLRPGDRLTVGNRELEFRSDRFRAVPAADQSGTVRAVTRVQLAMVAGDVHAYSTISQYTEEDVLLESIGTLYGALRSDLGAQRGTLNNYVGDAFFAIWEVDAMPDAARRAARFAVDAVETVRTIAPTLPLRDAAGKPVTMGWGVVLGRAAMSSFPGSHVTVLGDATNLAFRLSGLAGRDGRAPVLVTEPIREQLGEGYTVDLPTAVEVKGRTGSETVYGLRAATRPS